MSLKEVVFKLHSCAVQSQAKDEVVILAFPGGEFTDKSIVCVKEGEWTKILNRTPLEEKKNMSILSERERRMILAEDVNSPKMGNLVNSIVESHLVSGKTGNKDGSTGIGWVCTLKNEDLERLDRKR